MTRDDLLTLTPDTLAALANRGLVKRAAKELDAGTGPAVEVADDGTVHGRWDDGVHTALPPHTELAAAPCSCAAPGVCRHRVALVLAYQRHTAGTDPGGGAPDEPPFTPWSPGAIDDDTLTRALGARALTAARRAHRAGYPARLHRPTPADPVPRAELPSCTVRFLVPGEPGYAHTDASAAAKGEMVTLAVWAFREADRRGLDGDEPHLDVGGRAEPAAAEPGSASVLPLLEQLLLDGAAHAGPVLPAGLRRAERELDDKGMRWPAAALADLAEQLDAHRDRAAHYRAERLAELIAEVHARHRAATRGGASPRSRVLGTDEPAETALRRVRLTGLGCRVGGTGTERTAELYLAHGDSGTVLVLRKRWPLGEDETLTGAELAGRRLGGVPLRNLAAGNVVSESAVRSAGRVLRLAAGRIAKTGVTPLGRAWEHLPATVAPPDLATLGKELAELPPRPVRPRVAAELVRVVPVAEVRSIGYAPGDQRLEAVIADAAGTTATVSAEYHPASPAALDHLAAALAGEFGAPRFVSGTVQRARGGVRVDPVAVVTDTGPHLPDLAPGDGSAALAAARPEPADPLDDALHTALAACAEAAHRGLRHTTPGLRDRLAAAARSLTAVGLRRAADRVTALTTELTALKAADDEGDTAVAAWVEAQLWLGACAEFR
ncbi:hypothetical protein GCM10027168_17110 [Streptomyces capparidis]